MRKILASFGIASLLVCFAYTPAFAVYSGTPSLLINGLPASSTNPVPVTTPSTIVISNPTGSPIPVVAPSAIPVTAATPLPITGSTYSRTEAFTSITSGSSQTLLSAAAITHGCEIQNNTTGTAYVRFDGGTVTTTNGFVLLPNASYTCPVNGIPTAAVTIYTSVTGTLATDVW